MKAARIVEKNHDCSLYHPINHQRKHFIVYIYIFTHFYLLPSVVVRCVLTFDTITDHRNIYVCAYHLWLLAPLLSFSISYIPGGEWVQRHFKKYIVILSPKNLQYKRWCIDWLFTVLRPAQEFFTYKDTSPLPVKGCKIWAYVRRWGPLSREGFYLATPAVTWDLGFSGLIRKTAAFSRLIRWGDVEGLF
jgi:hypothetical protein